MFPFFELPADKLIWEYKKKVLQQLVMYCVYSLRVRYSHCFAISLEGAAGVFAIVLVMLIESHLVVISYTFSCNIIHI